MSAQRSDGGAGKRRHLRAVRAQSGGGESGGSHSFSELQEFLVDSEDGTPYGIVDDVVTDGHGRLIGLLVAIGGLGRRRITSVTPDEIVEILPLERRVVVSRRPDDRPARWWRPRG